MLNCVRQTVHCELGSKKACMANEAKRITSSYENDIIKKRIDVSKMLSRTRKEGIGAPTIDRPLQRHGGRLEHNETYCGSCYGAEGSDDHCCNTCEDVREAYRKKGWALTNPDQIDQCKREGFLEKIKEEEGEGCNIWVLEVNKGLEISTLHLGRVFSSQMFMSKDLLTFQKDSYNISHKINRLTYENTSQCDMDARNTLRHVSAFLLRLYLLYIQMSVSIPSSQIRHGCWPFQSIPVFSSSMTFNNQGDIH
ncbi:hypothetical protein HAX54_036256 [Datura stramonium]|uniref:Endoplasmic reticulum vesicle transporter C-terminal domain-containing protein n=1 Tax=Datura stramonium TaxID=4076 RepID=A0ABS8VKF5_DATST|nr:hypothetical protein [Datura stramonium]